MTATGEAISQLQTSPPGKDGLPPIFARFSAYSGKLPADYMVCFIGDKIHRSIDGASAPDHDSVGAAPNPGVDEELFEWMDVLQAAHDAKGAYTFIELGAAYGRWSVRAALAAKQLNKTIRLGLAEAEPKHVQWLHSHLKDNHVAPGEYTVYEAAVDGEAGQAQFAVGIPGSGTQYDHWFGQAPVSYSPEAAQECGDYYGQPLYEVGKGGWQFIHVPQITISTILQDFDHVDLMDMDIQGSEARAVAEAIEPITAKVRKLHIGTHSAEVEASLRDTLAGAGWVCLRDYPCAQENDTEYGRCYFVDGVQTWDNPRLA